MFSIVFCLFFGCTKCEIVEKTIYDNLMVQKKQKTLLHA